MSLLNWRTWCIAGFFPEKMAKMKKMGELGNDSILVLSLVLELLVANTAR